MAQGSTRCLAADIFYYNSISDALPSATSSELIQDFQVGDKIDVSKIDANTTKGGNNAFSFIGDAAFTGAAGELRVSVVGTDTIVQANVNADLVADFQIRLTGVVPLTAIDFIL